MVKTESILLNGGWLNYSSTTLREAHMTLCPVAIAVGCMKCPVFSVCPVKGIIGDYKKEETDQPSRDKKVNASETEKK